MNTINNSHMQHNLDAWKKMTDKQAQYASTMTDELIRLRKLGVDQVFEGFDELQRVSKDLVEQARDTVDPVQAISTWKVLMDRQVEAAAEVAKSASQARQDGMEQADMALDSFTKLSETTLDHAMKLRKAFFETAMETLKRSTERASSL